MTAHAINPRGDSRVVPAAVATGVLCVAAAGWIVLVRRMAGMNMGPATPGGDPGALGWFAVTWVVMTAAMMLPGSAPAVVRAVRTARSQGARGAATALAFVVAYGTAWLLAGLAGYACVQGVRALHLSALGWTSAGRYVAAAGLIAAGLYQFTGVKRRWLARCIAPERHLPGPALLDALRAGGGHGVCCVACCWTLMVALYALGIMSISWMVVLTVLIAAERLASPTPVAVAGVAAVVLMLGVGVAAAPASVPGLNLPPPGHAAMSMSMP
jgi:predicted metal-binding membrane protein